AQGVAQVQRPAPVALRLDDAQAGGEQVRAADGDVEAGADRQAGGGGRLGGDGGGAGGGRRGGQRQGRRGARPGRRGGAAGVGVAGDGVGQLGVQVVHVVEGVEQVEHGRGGVADHGHVGDAVGERRLVDEGDVDRQRLAQGVLAAVGRAAVVLHVEG